MLAMLRADGAGELDPSGHQRIVEAHANSELATPAQVGHVLASLTLSASRDLSGKFVKLNGEECKDHRSGE
jgi:hypothetical protein